MRTPCDREAGKITCYLCSSENRQPVPGRVRDNDQLSIWRCSNCGLVFLSSNDHITEQFYDKSGMHGGAPDIETWQRETFADDQRRYRDCLSFVRGKRVLDFGSGNAGFLSLAGKEAAYAAGVEKDRAVINHYKSAGIPLYNDISQIREKFDTITIFHVLEHLKDPRETLLRLKQFLVPGGRMLIEVPNSNDALLSIYNCRPFSEFTYWSPHLFLFSGSTLCLLFEQVGAKVDAIGYVQRYPISNHLYWLARGEPGGHTVWGFLDSPNMASEYEKQLAAKKATDTISARLYF